MRQTSRPESGRNLPNTDLDTSHEDLSGEAFLDLGRVGGLEEELQGLDEVGASLLDRGTLAGDIYLGAEAHVAIALPQEDGRELVGGRHGQSVALRSRGLAVPPLPPIRVFGVPASPIGSSPPAPASPGLPTTAFGVLGQ